MNQPFNLRHSSVFSGESLCLKLPSAPVWRAYKRSSIQAKVVSFPPELEEATQPPLNLYKPKEPYTAKIVSVERIVGPKAPGETCHIVIDHGGNVPYWEGQSIGVIPPVSEPYSLPSSLCILYDGFVSG